MHGPSKQSLKVLFLYPPAPELREHLARELAGAALELHYAAADHALDDPGLLALAAQAQVLVGSRPTADFLALCPQARLFQLPWAGVNPLLPALREGNDRRRTLGLPPLMLANNHGVCPATAQHAVAMLLALTNQLVLHDRWMRAGQWRMGDAAARSLPLRDDVSIGLLGYGAINQRVHELLAPFGLRISALRRSSRNPRRRDLSSSLTRVYSPPELHAFLRATDILVIAVPHTRETEGLLGKSELKLLGQDGGVRRSLPLLVNVARGAVVDEAALYHALTDGTLAGAGLDVWYDYRPEADQQGRKFPWSDPAAHPFHELPNVLLSPHRAASPLDDLRRWDPVISNLRRLAKGEQAQSIVNLAAGY